jgi:hypothetical protein
MLFLNLTKKSTNRSIGLKYIIVMKESPKKKEVEKKYQFK